MFFFMPFKCSFYRFSDDYRGGGWPDGLKVCGRGGITDVNYIVCSDLSLTCVCVCVRTSMRMWGAVITFREYVRVCM